MIDPQFVENYRTRWERKAMVRSLSRRVLPEVRGNADPYPILRQPLGAHPVVRARGPKVISSILLQSCYKYMEDIALTETELVCRITTRIANGRTGYELPRGLDQVALSVVTDEAYHAYVARDFIEQLADISATPPIAHPRQTELSMALEATLHCLPREQHADLELIAVAIAENTLTREIVDLRADPNLDDAFRLALADHLSDEAQHAGFFQLFLKLFWRQLNMERRIELGRALPAFLIGYLGVDVQRGFDLTVLNSVGFTADEAAGIVEDCHDGFELGPSHPMLCNVLRLLESAGVLADQPVRDGFRAAGLLAP